MRNVRGRKRLVAAAVAAGAVFAGSPAALVAESYMGYVISTEQELGDAGYAAKIEEFWKTAGKEDKFNSPNKGVAIRYVRFVQPDKAREKGAIVVSSGRTETYLKYKELIFDLWRNGYSVYVHDHRGQGLSGREPEVVGEPQKGHVENFGFFVADLRKFVGDVVEKGGHANHFLIAHSMGGVIASLYLEEDPKPFQAAAMTSPMHEIQSLGGLEPLISCPIAHILSSFWDSGYVLQGHGYQPPPFTNNDYTGSEIRYERLLAEYKKEPKVQLGSPTHGWLARACDAAKKSRNEADRIRIPVRLFQGGSDKIVHANGHKVFCENYRKAAPAGCDGKGGGPVVMKDAKHELLIEKDGIRHEVVAGILSFFEKNRKP